MRYLLFCLGLVLSQTSFAKHPIESISVGQMTHVNNKIHVKLRCLEEGLAASLANFTNRQIVFDYDQPAFGQELLKVIESYMKANLQVTVNQKVLVLKLVSAHWVKDTQYSDHAAIAIEVSFACPKQTLNTVKVKNTLLSAVSNQQNILHVHLKGEDLQTVVFDNRATLKELSF